VISSPGPGDGKTTVAANLAVAMAEVGERVILVDADLRHPGVAERFGIASEPGLTSVLIDQVQLPDAIRRITPRLAILPSGPPPPNPAELLGSEAASGVFAYLRANADIVIIDAPPLLAVTDAVVLATYADAIAMVARLGRTTRDTTVEARRRLDVVNARIAGCIVNCTNPGETYGSRYRYPGPLRKERSKARRDDDPRRDAHLVEPDKDSVVDEPALP
jgi:capsular exopolysaccharide synthesis family protein